MRILKRRRCRSSARCSWCPLAAHLGASSSQGDVIGSDQRPGAGQCSHTRSAAAPERNRVSVGALLGTYWPEPRTARVSEVVCTTVYTGWDRLPGKRLSETPGQTLAECGWGNP